MYTVERIKHALSDRAVIGNYVAQRRKLLRWRFQQRHNRGIFSVNIERGCGFFAVLSKATWILSYCHQSRLIPHITSSNPFYVDPARGPDFLAYFFENPQQSRIDGNVVARTNIYKIQQLGLPTRCISKVTLEDASMLVPRYLRIRPEILEEVEQFARANFEGRPVVGIHYRGNDKYREAPHVAPERCVRVVRRFLDEHPEVERVFVATDVAPFVTYVQDELRSVRVCFCDDLRSDGTVAVHQLEFAGDKYQKGREALVNCMLMARCDTLIRCSSTMSGWASIFNPRLPVIMLNEPHPHTYWFPDRLVIPRAKIAAP